FEIREKRRPHTESSTNDRPIGRRHNRRRRHHPVALRRLRESKDALAQPEHIRNGRSATSKKENDALSDCELRRADDDAAKTSQRSSRNAELHDTPQTSLQIRLSFEGDERLDASTSVFPLWGHRHDPSSRYGHGVVRELAQ